MKRTILKGKAVFIIALITIGLTFLTVYLTGINYNRSLSSNLFIALGIIATVLFLFLAYGLYKGIRLVNNYPKFENYHPGAIMHEVKFPEFGIYTGDGIEGVILSILLWIGMAVLMVVMLVVFEAIFWLSLFVIFATLYWIFIRALKLVFIKSSTTKGDFASSVYTAFIYTLLYTGWIFGIAFVVQTLQ